eukprot:m.77207 g.77207  ORF g.77207 m.77207 type:complete len:50 (+) comp8537_c0_seq1:166-315(+)
MLTCTVIISNKALRTIQFMTSATSNFHNILTRRWEFQFLFEEASFGLHF